MLGCCFSFEAGNEKAPNQNHYLQFLHEDEYKLESFLLDRCVWSSEIATSFSGEKLVNGADDFQTASLLFVVFAPILSFGSVRAIPSLLCCNIICRSCVGYRNILLTCRLCC